MMAAVSLFSLVVPLAFAFPVSAETMTAGGENHLATDLTIPFGHSLLDKEFILNYTNFNHGSFGSCPHTVLEEQSRLRMMQEQAPDPWMRETYKKMLNQTRQDIAKFVGAETDDIVLVESASTASNSILRSMDWDEGDILVYFSVAYGMIRNTAQWLHEMYNVDLVAVPITFPIACQDDFLHAMQTSLQSIDVNRLRLVVLDHIVSVPAVREPVKGLAQLIKSHNPNAFVMVDGAHAMGQVEKLAIGDLGPIDAYLSNGHKWCYSPKGSAFLWVDSAVTTDVFPEPTVISSGNPVGPTSFSQRYAYVSTRDYTAFVSMSKALKFREELGGEEAIYKYVHGLAMEAKAYLVDLWDVTALAPDNIEDYMINILLPDGITDTEMGKALHDWLYEKHNMYMLVLYQKEDDYFFTRLSAQVYLEFSDFVRLGEAVLKFLDEAPKEQR